MHYLRFAGRPALCLSLLSCFSACSAQADEPSLLLTDPRAALTKPADESNDFPLLSSRRTWSSNRLKTDRIEPEMFTPVDAKPLPDADSLRRLLPRGSFAEPYPLQPYSLDTWGLHPGTPVPTPVSRLGVLIDDQIRPAVAEETVVDKTPAVEEEELEIELVPVAPKSDDGEQSGQDLQQNEAAKVILELMETLGRSVLDGTVFQKPSKADQKWLKELDAAQVKPREALIQYIRALEAQQRTASVCRNECEAQCALHGHCDLECGQKCAVAPYRPGGTSDYCPGNTAYAPANTGYTCPQSHTGPMMFGVGVNTNAGLVGHMTLNCDGASKCACGDKCPCHSATVRAICPAEQDVADRDFLVSATLAGRSDVDVEEDDDDDEAEEAVDSLRGASEMLDHMACTLERKELYARADQLRDMAQQLRTDARRMKPGPASGSYPAGPPMPMVWDMPFPGPSPFQPGAQFAYPQMAPMQAYPTMNVGPYAPSAPPSAYVMPEPPQMAQPSLTPAVPQPTYERPSREKDLEREVHMLRDELRKLHQALSSRSEEPRR